MKMKNIFRSLFISLTLVITGCDFKRYSNTLIIAQKPYKVVYAKNEAFDPDGLVVVDKDGEKVEDYDCSLSKGSFLKQLGTREVKITKETYKPASFKIEVKGLPKLVVKQMPNKTLYHIGEYFTVDGLIITDDNSEEINDYTLSYRVGDAFTSIGEKEIKVTKEGYFATSFKVVVEKDLELVINHMPNKTNYNLGDAFDSTGLSVGDNKGKTNLKYTLSIQDGDILKYAGTIPVNISVDGYFPISFNIEVKDNGGHQQKEDQEINIYYINDTHGSFIRNDSEKEAGMAYISSYMKEKKASETENAIIISGGDMFQGGCESNDTYGNIMTEAMNIAGFDAMVLGNHEFDWGEEKIIANKELMNFPLLSCNTFYEGTTQRPDWVEPFTVIQRGDIKVGLVGYAQTNLGSSIDEEYGGDFSFPNPISYIKEYATTLRLSYNCDLVLAAGHDGGFDDDGRGSAYEELTNTNSQTNTRYVDGLMFAHDHNRKQGKLNDVPYMESGCNGKGIAHMKFNMKSNGIIYTVDSSEVNVSYSYNLCTTEDREVTSLVDKYKSQFLADPDSVLRVLDRTYSQSEFCEAICQSMVWFINSNSSKFDNAHVYVASHNLGGVRVNSVPRGNLTYRDLIKAYPFDNKLCISFKCRENNVLNIFRNSNPYWKLSDPVYDEQGYTQCATISYVAGKSYARNQFPNYKKYEGLTAKLAFIRFLQSNEVISV